jgi:hypothetical protein
MERENFEECRASPAVKDRGADSEGKQAEKGQPRKCQTSGRSERGDGNWQCADNGNMQGLTPMQSHGIISSA